MTNHIAPSASSAVPLSALSAQVQRYAAKPYGQNAQTARKYHLEAYETWCKKEHVQPFPLDLDRLLAFAAARAQTYAFFTVREDVRIVAMEHRKTTGEDLYSNTRIATLLHGLRRKRPPRPVLPLIPRDMERIIEHRGRTWKTRRSRVMAMLIWAAGFTLTELHHLDAEMLLFSDRGVDARFRDIFDVRDHIFVGRARDSARCPVAALEALLAEREISAGPVFFSTPRRVTHVRFRLAYTGVIQAIRLLGIQVGFPARLSVERIRRGGLIAQSQHVDIVTLAHYHGLSAIEHLSSFIDANTERPARFKWKRRRSYT